MSWRYTSNRSMPEIGVTVIAVYEDGEVTRAVRENDGYWWKDLQIGEDMKPPVAWTYEPNTKENS